MTGSLQPLNNLFPIVNGNGTPTDYFVRWAQQRQQDITGSVSQDTKIIAGNGLGGGGSLTGDVTLSLDADLNDLNDVTITSPSNGQALVYSGGIWINGTVQSLPSGGTTGQVLAKASATNYDVVWSTPHYVPAGGTTGQVLAKTSATDYALAWTTPTGLTYGGNAVTSLVAGTNVTMTLASGALTIAASGGGSSEPGAVPTSADFPTVIGSAATHSWNASSGLMLSAVTNSTGIQGVRRTTSGAVTITAKLGGLLANGFNSYFIFLTDGTKYLTFGVLQNASSTSFTPDFQVGQWSAATTFASAAADPVGHSQDIKWFRIVWSGTSAATYVSVDGIQWAQYGVTANTYLTTVTGVGMGVNRNNTTASPAAWFQRWS